MMVALGMVWMVGCATSSQLEDQSRVHGLRADAAARQHNYELAAAEKHKAADLHEQAVKKAYKEGNAGNVTVPSEVPPAQPPGQTPME
jgi:hypothetical protein